MLNAAAARVVSDTQKFDHGLSKLMHTELHWLDVPERVKYKLGVLMYRCQHDGAPQYLMDYCSPVSGVVFRQRLRSASSHQLFIPCYWLSTYGRRAFSVAAPTVWNSLPEDLQDPECSFDTSAAEDIFIFTVAYLCVQRIRGFDVHALYKSTFYIDNDILAE